MRKLSNILCVFLVLSLLAGCGMAADPPAGQGETDAFLSNTSQGFVERDEPKETEREPETRCDLPTVKLEPEQTKEPESVESQCIALQAQYIRTYQKAGYDEVPKKTSRVVRSADELNAYYEEFKDTFYLGRNETVYADTTIGFVDACDRFDETFWAEYDLVLATTTEGSGSIRHEAVNMVSTDGGSEWVINFRKISPTMQTCDVAFWYFLIEVPKGVIEETDTVRFQMVNDDYRLGLYTGNVQAIRTDNDEVADREAPSYFFLESRDELTEYCESNGMTAGFVDACDQYDESFWKKNKLLVVIAWEGSGSIRHEAVEIFQNALFDDEWYLRINRLQPATQSADEAVWHFLIGIPTYDIGTGEAADPIDSDAEIHIVYKDVQVEDNSLYSAQHIRTDSETEEDYEPIIKLLTSQEELDVYINANKDRYEMVWRDWENREMTAGFLNACERFTTLFWEQNDLVMIVLRESNKWTRHTVESIVFTEGIPQSYTITVSRTTAQESSEPADWHILLPMPKGQVLSEEYIRVEWMEVCTGEK